MTQPRTLSMLVDFDHGARPTFALNDQPMTEQDGRLWAEHFRVIAERQATLDRTKTVSHAERNERARGLEQADP